MENIHEARREIQLAGYNAWKNNGCVGFVQMSTGTGKSWVMLDALSDEKTNAKCIILSETRKRDNQYPLEREKFMRITGKQVSAQPILETYQTAYKFKGEHYRLVIADEADYIGLKYSEFFKNNTYDRILLLSATRSESVKYRNEFGDEFTKKDILDSIAPLVFSHTAKEGLNDGTSRVLDVVVYKHKLESEIKDCEFPYSKTKITKNLTEEKAYKLYTNRFEYIKSIPPTIWKTNAVKKWANLRAQFLYSLPSKIRLIKKLLNNIDGKTIVFGNNLDGLYSLTQNTISSRNTDEFNKKLIDDISSGAIQCVGVNKILTRGSNIPNLDNVILMSFQASADLAIQRWGRLRLNGDLKGKLYLFVTEGTQEEVWFNKIKPSLEIYNIIYKSSKEIK